MLICWLLNDIFNYFEYFHAILDFYLEILLNCIIELFIVSKNEMSVNDGCYIWWMGLTSISQERFDFKEVLICQNWIFILSLLIVGTCGGSRLVTSKVVYLWLIYRIIVYLWLVYNANKLYIGYTAVECTYCGKCWHILKLVFFGHEQFYIAHYVDEFRVYYV